MFATSRSNASLFSPREVSTRDLGGGGRLTVISRWAARATRDPGFCHGLDFRPGHEVLTEPRRQRLPVYYSGRRLIRSHRARAILNKGRTSVSRRRTTNIRRIWCFFSRAANRPRTYYEPVWTSGIFSRQGCLWHSCCINILLRCVCVRLYRFILNSRI